MPAGTTAGLLDLPLRSTDVSESDIFSFTLPDAQYASSFAEGEALSVLPLVDKMGVVAMPARLAVGRWTSILPKRRADRASLRICTLPDTPPTLRPELGVSRRSRRRRAAAASSAAHRDSRRRRAPARMPVSEPAAASG